MFPTSVDPIVQYRILRNVTAPGLYYMPGHRLWLDPIVFSIPNERDIVGAIDARHRDPNRPDKDYAPPLTVGDLIAFDWATPRCRYHSIDPFGSSQVDHPHLHTVITGLTYEEAFNSNPHLR